MLHGPCGLHFIHERTGSRGGIRSCSRGGGRSGTYALNTELMELSESACLRLFIAVATASITNLYGKCCRSKRIFDNRTYYACCKFGA